MLFSVIFHCFGERIITVHWNKLHARCTLTVEFLFAVRPDPIFSAFKCCLFSCKLECTVINFAFRLTFFSVRLFNLRRVMRL